MRHPILLSMLLLTSPARADGCLPPKKLLAGALICEDNHLYQSAGQACLEKLERAVKNQQAITGAALDEQTASLLGEGRNRQEANFDASGSDYRRAGEDLASLIAKARETQRSLDAYRDSVVYPADWQDYAESKPALLAALWGQPCYSAAAGSLDAGLDRVRVILSELEAAKATAAGLGKISGQRLSGIAAENPSKKVVKGGLGAGSLAPARPRAPASRSTITGDTKKVTVPKDPGGPR